MRTMLTLRLAMLCSDCFYPQILDPQSIPSRMTVGHILEMFYGQALLLNRKRGDTTAFTHSYAASLNLAELYSDELLATGAALGNADLSKIDVNDRMDTIARVLKSKGHHSSGNQRMYNGKVGLAAFFR